VEPYLVAKCSAEPKGGGRYPERRGALAGGSAGRSTTLPEGVETKGVMNVGRLKKNRISRHRKGKGKVGKKEGEVSSRNLAGPMTGDSLGLQAKWAAGRPEEDSSPTGERQKKKS